MKSTKEQEAKDQIMAILHPLNMSEVRNVLGAISLSLGQKATFVQKSTRQLSKIESDRELYEFIMNLDLEFMTQKDVLSACIAKFGKVRAPSRTGLNRAFNKLLNRKGDES
ncbi:primosomal protein [Vibrio parahaemolyticus]|uniref:primosomal protein n=1 Tax=Vibrio TaxID=662 RepID=UPI00132EEC5C|nr:MULTISPECIES: primosomal protein [Vibrio]MBE3698487.1 primosomal protein [Vibrio parahaemolyticus]MBE3777938.1 primosomal protein [Vibrio parahaemolyticus]MCZ6246283.1 primosomal protein [Vibrio parahaemolyticus]MDE0551211.1 primosomal protein [Vibrio sp. VP6]QHG93788.1 primosomal protein [Vibrio parahaemolyticus]